MQQYGNLQLEIIVNGPINANCYIVADVTSGDALIVDPGAEPERIASFVAEKKWRVAQIAATHAHVDHIGAAAPLQALVGKPPIALHGDDLQVLATMSLQAGVFGFERYPTPEIDVVLNDADTYQIGSLGYRVVHTPGHSPGGCCFYFEEQKVLLTGDTLFAGTIGRCDLPGGDGRALLTSVRTKLLTLDDAVTVYPGHGPSTTIGQERRTNPYASD